MKVTCIIPLSESQLERIRGATQGLDVVVADSPEKQEAHLPDTDVLFGRFAPAMLDRAKEVKWVQVPWVGVEPFLVDPFLSSPIPLVNAKGVMGIPMAEHTWALILALTRGVSTAMRERRWESRRAIRSQVWELAGKSIGIVGLGSVGTEVARRAVAFGMEVLAIRRGESQKPPFVSQVWKSDRLHDLLALSDIVVICTPLTQHTQGMFDLEAFRHMRRHALLINVGRGQIVHDEALLQALREGLIGGAGLDVVATEPVPEDSPLWDMENVVLTPHVGGDSPQNLDRAVDLLCTNLERYATGLPLLNVVDKQEGY